MRRTATIDLLGSTVKSIPLHYHYRKAQVDRGYYATGTVLGPPHAAGYNWLVDRKAAQVFLYGATVVMRV